MCVSEILVSELAVWVMDLFGPRNGGCEPDLWCSVDGECVNVCWCATDIWTEIAA